MAKRLPPGNKPKPLSKSEKAAYQVLLDAENFGENGRAFDGMMHTFQDEETMKLPPGAHVVHAMTGDMEERARVVVAQVYKRTSRRLTKEERPAFKTSLETGLRARIALVTAYGDAHADAIALLLGTSSAVDAQPSAPRVDEPSTKTAKVALGEIKTPVRQARVEITESEGRKPTRKREEAIETFAASKVPVHPGALLAAYLDLVPDRTAAHIARACGLSPAFVSRFITGQRDCNADTAIRLEAATCVPAEEWMHAQAAYDLHAIHSGRANAPTTTPPTIEQLLAHAAKG